VQETLTPTRQPAGGSGRKSVNASAHLDWEGILGTVLPDVRPMLAGTGLPTTTLDDWAVEPKLDGWRALISVEAGRLRVRTRRGRDITDVVPELHGLANCDHDVLLDGELCARGGRMEDFARLSGRLAGRPKSTSLAVSLVVFDLLWLDGVDQTRRTYETRRAALLELDLRPASIVPSFPGVDAPAVLRFCDAAGLEGLMFKRLASPYRQTRSHDWRKVKVAAWQQYAAQRRPPHARQGERTFE
jgi:bifunctional non-homologous end joining protein LigD